MADRNPPQNTDPNESLWVQRSAEVARAKASAPAAKEPFDAAKLAGHTSFGSPHRTGSPTPDEKARRVRELEYEYYVLSPRIMTLREFGELLARSDLFD